MLINGLDSALTQAERYGAQMRHLCDTHSMEYWSVRTAWVSFRNQFDHSIFTRTTILRAFHSGFYREPKLRNQYISHKTAQ